MCYTVCQPGKSYIIKKPVLAVEAITKHPQCKYLGTVRSESLIKSLDNKPYIPA